MTTTPSHNLTTHEDTEDFFKAFYKNYEKLKDLQLYTKSISISRIQDFHKNVLVNRKRELPDRVLNSFVVKPSITDGGPNKEENETTDSECSLSVDSEDIAQEEEALSESLTEYTIGQKCINNRSLYDIKEEDTVLTDSLLKSLSKSVIKTDSNQNDFSESRKLQIDSKKSLDEDNLSEDTFSKLENISRKDSIQLNTKSSNSQYNDVSSNFELCKGDYSNVCLVREIPPTDKPADEQHPSQRLKPIEDLQLSQVPQHLYHDLEPTEFQQSVQIEKSAQSQRLTEILYPVQELKFIQNHQLSKVPKTVQVLTAQVQPSKSEQSLNYAEVTELAQVKHIKVRQSPAIIPTHTQYSAQQQSMLGSSLNYIVDSPEVSSYSLDVASHNQQKWFERQILKQEYLYDRKREKMLQAFELKIRLLDLKKKYLLERLEYAKEKVQMQLLLDHAIRNKIPIDKALAQRVRR